MSNNIFIFTIILCLVHQVYANIYCKSSIIENKAYNKIVHQNITDFINIFIVIVISIMHLYSSLQLNTNNNSRLYGYNNIGSLALMLHISLLVYEIFYNILAEKNILMLFHHLLSSGSFLLALRNNFVTFYANLVGFAEITNLFLIPITIIKRNNVFTDKLIYPGIGLFISYLFARLILMPYSIYLGIKDIQHVKNEDKVMYLLLISSVILVFLLSFYWFQKIYKGLMKEYYKLKVM